MVFRSSRRRLGPRVGVLVVAIFAVAAAAAYAASGTLNLSVTGLPAHNNKNYTVKVSGTFSGTSSVSVFAFVEQGSTQPPCAANAYAEYGRSHTLLVIGHPGYTKSPYSFSSGSITARHVGGRRVCAYLDKGQGHDGNPPMAFKSKYFYVSP